MAYFASYIWDITLEGLLEIAAYFRKTPRTIQRWADEAGLPLHRSGKGPRARIHAFRSELSEWAGGQNFPRATAQQHSLKDQIVARASELLQASNLYRNNFVVRFTLRPSGLGVQARVETEYEIVNGSNTRQPYTQEVTIDDCERGYVELMSVSSGGNEISSLRMPEISRQCLGYVSYRGPRLMIDPDSSGKRFTGIAKWVIRRNENDFWYLHVGIPTFGISLFTSAPADFEITAPYSSPALVTVGQHIDITWRRRRRREP